jgi:hypothetical protein
MLIVTFNYKERRVLTEEELYINSVYEQIIIDTQNSITKENANIDSSKRRIKGLEEYIKHIRENKIIK